MKKISVIIPCYNVMSFIQKCVDSVLMQNGFDIEIILVNDGSKDKTRDILEVIACKHKNVKIINQENKGISEARNVGIANASGKLLMFVDADDWLEANALELTAKNFNDEDLFCFSYNRVFKNKIVPRKLNMGGLFPARDVQRRIVGLLGNELNDPSQADSMITVWGKIYKLDIIMRNNIRFTDVKEIGTAEDALFNLQYLEYAKTVQIIDIPLYDYVKINYSSFTKLHKPNLFLQWQTLFSKIFEIIKDKENDFQKAFYNRIALSIIGLGLNEVFSEKPFSEKKKKIAAILQDKKYIKAYQNLETRYFPVHWKLFFYFAKSKNASGILALSKLISRMIS